MKNIIKHFARDLINEYATYKPIQGLSLNINDVPRSDRRLFLSTILDIADYEWACRSEVRLDTWIKEYSKEMQEYIDENINDIWHESIREAGMHKNSYRDNGEIYYY